MWLSDPANYGRFLTGAAVLLSLLACEQRRPRTTEQVVAAAKTARLVVEPAPPATPVAPARAAILDAPLEDTGPEVSEVTDRTAPVLLAIQQFNPGEWDSLNAEWANWNTVTRFGRFCLVERHELPRLFYQAASHDSTWTEVELALSDEYWGAESGETELETVNLDGRGAAELVLRFHPARYGSGGGTAWDYVSVIEVSARPKLIFRALLAEENEAFGGYAQLHGYTIAPGEQYTGCKRSFKVRGRELVLGPIKTIGNTERKECRLTELPAGRYHYRNGRLLRAGK
ncbi:hypothetical protein Q5H93_12655 [Hymenobacter sp. ASUV-10]|uniref:Discoidin domain-containing protein n=1 Tax=Hymenobacter aranciens TaxID=3063996 RepID=A0ABT9BBF0_9BACT|nr:hypothetical protein [Hymenobacter sp. ASUV-10]MDO7875586.1 hypothetical protein [Hymenobacter sp. ASUV-10]